MIIITIIILIAIVRISQQNNKDLRNHLSSDNKNPTKQYNTKKIELDSGTFLAMGTLGHIKIISSDEIQAMKAIHAARSELKRLDALLSTYRENSELSKINRLAYKQPINISPETFELLKLSLKYSKLSNGAFDITVTPLIKLWKRVAKENRLATQEEITKAQKNLGYNKIILNDKSHTIKFASKSISLTVDAIAKGYIVDCMARAMKNISGVQAGLIEIGGEVQAFGQDWIIGIENPFEARKKGNPIQAISWRIKIRNAGVATSGNYRRYVTIKGKQYSHIINPHTGLPADKLPSVTVIAPTTADADALATTISVLGVKKGLALIESLKNTEAFIVAGTHDNMKIYQSKGMKQYLIPTDIKKCALGCFRLAPFITYCHNGL